MALVQRDADGVDRVQHRIVIVGLIALALALLEHVGGAVQFAALLVVFQGGGDGEQGFVGLAQVMHRFAAVQHHHFIGVQPLVVPGRAARGRLGQGEGDVPSGTQLTALMEHLKSNRLWRRRGPRMCLRRWMHACFSTEEKSMCHWSLPVDSSSRATDSRVSNAGVGRADMLYRKGT